MAVDHTKFSETGKPKSQSPTNNRRWWTLSDEELPENIASVVTFLQQSQGVRQRQLDDAAMLYGNFALLGLNRYAKAKASSNRQASKDRITYNVVQSGIDTITAKIGKSKPKSMFLTEGGDYRIQRRAQKLDQFTDGVRYENETEKLSPLIFRDGGIFGDGFVHVYDHYDRVKFDRVFSGELFTDDLESYYGFPRQLHRQKTIDRDVLIELFPKFAAQIKDCNSAESGGDSNYQVLSDSLSVRESFRLPSGPEATDGLHTITIDNALLSKERWTKNYFPYARFRWSPRLYGYWSQGGVEQIQNIQLEINRLLWVIQRSMHLAGTYKVWLKTGSKVSKEQINNDIGTIIKGEAPPQYLVPPIIQPEMYQHLRTLKDDAFERLGVSQLSAASQKPAGLDSGKALREYNDIESDRFMTIGQAYEQYHLDLDKLAISTAKDIYERTGKYKVKVPGKRFIQSINWKEIDLEDDEYVMKAYPVSALPNSPEGKFSAVQEYAQAGYYTPRQAKRLLDLPDTEAQDRLDDATEDYIHMVHEKMLYEGDYTPPEPEDDLQLALELNLKYYAYAKNTGVEESKLELLRQFKTQVQSLLTLAQPPAPPGPGAGQSQGVPQPPPQSDLLPNAPGAQAS